MVILLLIIWIGALMLMIISDIKYRVISAEYLIVFTLAIIFYQILKGYLIVKIMIDISINICLILNLFFGVAIVMSYYQQSIINLLDYIGLGDILFIIAITPLFDPIEYILFITISLILTLLCIISMDNKTKCITRIPLVSALGICLIGITIFNYINYGTF